MAKFCSNCGSEMNENEEVCPNCGQGPANSETEKNTVVENEANTGKAKVNPSAIGGLVCSIIGLFIMGIYMGVIAICLGAAGLKHIKAFENEKGKGIAIAAIAIGIFDVVFSVIGTVLISAT